MVDKPCTQQKPGLTTKTERVIPPDMRKVTEDIDRDLQRFYQVYSDSVVSTNSNSNNNSNSSQNQGSIRIQNIDIEQKLKGRMKNGMGIGFIENGDIYSGTWKDGKRDGSGSCKFFKGGCYKGEWFNDLIMGQGIRVYADGFTICGKFINNGQYVNGEYYEGQITFEKQKNGKGAYFYRNGDYYEGEWVNDLRIGKGRFLMDNGSEYKGQFNSDVAEGNGQFLDVNGNKFVNSKDNRGYFRNARLQQKGKAYFSNGDVYKGFFKDGCFDGYGKILYKHTKLSQYFELEAEYKGQWKHGRKQGQGKIKWIDGTSFKGTWHQDQRINGIMKMPKQYKIFSGQFQNDLFHGLGKITLIKLKISFEGIFNQGKCPLKGKIHYFDTDEIYEGEITDQFQREGFGQLTFKNKDQYEGQFQDNMIHGRGMIKYANGDYYKGEFMRDKKSGQGQYMNYRTKEIYDGQWRDDERNGEGILYLSDGSSQRGTWKGLQIVSKSAKESPPATSDMESLEKLYSWNKNSFNQKRISKKLKNNI